MLASGKRIKTGACNDSYAAPRCRSGCRRHECALATVAPQLLTKFGHDAALALHPIEQGARAQVNRLLVQPSVEATAQAQERIAALANPAVGGDCRLGHLPHAGEDGGPDDLGEEQYRKPHRNAAVADYTEREGLQWPHYQQRQYVEGQCLRGCSPPHPALDPAERQQPSNPTQERGSVDPNPLLERKDAGGDEEENLGDQAAGHVHALIRTSIVRCKHQTMTISNVGRVAFCFASRRSPAPTRLQVAD